MTGARSIALVAGVDSTLGCAPLPANQNPVDVYLSRLGSHHSRRTMAGALERMAGALTNERADARACPWWKLRYQETAALRARLVERYAPTSANVHLAALRGVLRESWRLGLMNAEAFHRAIDLDGVRGETLPAGRALSVGELAAIVGVCQRDRSPKGARDAAMLALLFSGGLRRSEVVALDRDDFRTDDSAIRVKKGKGRKARLVYLDAGGQRAVEAWLAHRGEDAGPLLFAVNKGGKIMRRRLSTQAVLDACAARSNEAKVEAFSPHDLRRTFISFLLDAGADLVTVQKLAGHASPTTTSRYDRRGEVAKQKAASLLHFPWR